MNRRQLPFDRLRASGNGISRLVFLFLYGLENGYLPFDRLRVNGNRI
jgi:hypothetical protein